MSDTNVLKFSLRERGWIATKIFKTAQTKEPGDVYLITCDPFGAIVGDAAGVPYASALALTLSRFRDFKYIGTRCSFVPVASTGSVDPAHVAQVLSTPVAQNALHPRDIGNMVHWRRWTGGQFPVPHVKPTGQTSGTYSEQDAYNLDAAWLSDSRFNHVQVCDGFSFWARPLRSTLEAGGMMVNSFFGYQSSSSISPYLSAGTSYQDKGQTAITARDVVPDSWVPNPFAGFKYSSTTAASEDPANPGYEITGFVTNFPWFSDYINTGSGISLNSLLPQIKARLMAPIAIVRLPPAYGSKYYWTIYMRHYFAVRRPWIVNSAWLAGRVEAYHPPQTDPEIDPSNKVALGQEGLLVRSPEDDVQLVQMIGPDPYGAESSPAMLRMPESYVSIWAMQDDDLGQSSKPDVEVDEIDAMYDPESQPEPEPEKEAVKEPEKEVVKE